MPLRLEPAWSLSLPELAGLLTRGYDGYFVPLAFDPPALARMTRIHGIDLATSRVAFLDDRPVGLALLAHRGWTTRLAAMGIAPEVRSRGIGKALLDDVIAAGRQRGDRFFTLEVIEDNTPAVRLYEKSGFTTRRRLRGYRCDAPAGNPELAASVAEVDIREVAYIVRRYEPFDNPWQVSGETIGQLGPPMKGYRRADAVAVVQQHAAHVELAALMVFPVYRRQGQATRLLQGLFGLYPGMPWKIPARFPEEIPARLFTKLGFVEEKLRQKHMFLSLSEGGSPAPRR